MVSDYAAGAGVYDVMTPAKATNTFIESLITAGDVSGGMRWYQASMNDFVEQAVAGTGAVTVASRETKLDSGATNSSTARAYLMGGGQTMWQLGAGVQSKINWDKRVVMSAMVSCFKQSVGGIGRLYLGPAPADAVQDLDDKGIGFDLTALVLTGVTYGSSLQTDTLGTTSLVDETPAVLTVTSDGLGNVEWFVNGVSKGTDAGGPTGLSTVNHDNIVIMVSKATEAATVQDFRIHDLTIGVVQ